MVDERVLAERLISYDTSRAEELVAAAGFVKGWLESRDIEVQDHEHNALPVLIAAVGPPANEVPSVIFHGHLDVVPGRHEQFTPQIECDRLIGRGAYGKAAHSSTPWLGENAVLKAVDAFRAIQSLPFTRESSELFDAPSINLGRIEGGDALNMVPDACRMAVDVRYLPGQDPEEVMAQIRTIEGIEIERSFLHPPVTVSRNDRHVQA